MNLSEIEKELLSQWYDSDLQKHELVAKVCWCLFALFSFIFVLKFFHPDTNIWIRFVCSILMLLSFIFVIPCSLAMMVSETLSLHTNFSKSFYYKGISEGFYLYEINQSSFYLNCAWDIHSEGIEINKPVLVDLDGTFSQPKAGISYHLTSGFFDIPISHEQFIRFLEVKQTFQHSLLVISKEEWEKIKANPKEFANVNVIAG